MQQRELPRDATNSSDEQLFPPLHIVRSGNHGESNPHTLTQIVLHGRGSNGQDHEIELFQITEPQTHLLKVLPAGTKFIFPTAPMRLEPVFQEEMNEWFCIDSLVDVDRNQRTQAPGIVETIKYLDRIIEDEVEALNGDASRVFLGGISQGGAVGIWVLLYQLFIRKRRLGGFWAVSTWLPFSTLFSAGDSLAQLVSDMCAEEPDKSVLESVQFLAEIVAAGRPTHGLATHPKVECTVAVAPIFLGHGLDDARIAVDLGHRARDCLTSCGQPVRWQEYTGASLNGHWFKEPEALGHIGEFLMQNIDDGHIL